ncbi:MAG: hypothetical protein CVU64_03015 [Deltaproteobacteria bacterium HGW-Deltaproteobacteria-21]|nr:MAG: hypothetical protein CVU64_03015 [Deltaproteobacteria bacterium HGW-Deltaproteobacteria-21]
MLLSKEDLARKNAIYDFDRKIEEMHLQIQRYSQGAENRLPDWERLEMELLHFSRKKINDLELAKNLERVQYKFQNRKKIWLRWIEETHHSAGVEKEST